MKRPLIMLIAGFLTGVFLADLFSPEILSGIRHAVFFITVVLFFSAVCFFKKRILFYIFLSSFFLFLGFSRYISSLVPLRDDISHHITSYPLEITVHGIVYGESEWKTNKYGRGINFPVKVDRFLLDEEEKRCSGKMLADIPNPKYVPLIGDEIVITGQSYLPKGKTNPSGFDYRQYLKFKGINSIINPSGIKKNNIIGTYTSPVLSIKRSLFRIRRDAEKILDRYVVKEAAGLTKAAVLGIRGDVTERIKEAFKKTGIMHILAVSGLHISVLVFILVSVLGFLRFSKKAICICAITAIFIFVIIAGGRSAALRAGVMGALVIFGMLFGRKSDIVNVVILSAFLIIFFDPGQLFDSGCILSYIAVLSIVYITPFIDSVICKMLNREKLCFSNKAGTYMVRLFSVSVAVWAGMIPVMSHFFRIIPFTGVIMNFAAIPLLFTVIILGLVVLCTGSIAVFNPVASLAGAGLGNIIRIFVRLAENAADMPGAFIKVGSLNFWLVTGVYSAVMCILFFKNDGKKALRLLMLFLFLGNIFIWNEFLIKPPKELCVTFFDSGKSDTILFEFPDGATALVDCGEGSGKNIIEPYLRDRGKRNIDCVFITHFHEDHCGGIPHIAENFKIRTVITGDIPGRDNLYFENLKKSVEEKQIRMIKVARGDIITGFRDTSFIVLNPCRGRKYDSENGSSLMMKNMYKKTGNILLCGDIEKEAIRELLSFGSMLESDIVKAPHHGTFPAAYANLYKDFYKKTRCGRIIITNKNKERIRSNICNLLKEKAVNVYITGENGAVIVKRGEEIPG